MGVRIEWILIVMVVSIVLFSYNINIKNNTISNTILQKDLEFFDTTFREVNTTSTIYKLYTRYGVLQNKQLNIKHILYSDTNINYISAKNAVIYDNIVYLENDVKIYQKDGYKYFANEVIYNKKTKVLNIPTQFKAIMSQNEIIGINLQYDSNQKTLLASQLKAKLELQKSKEK